MNQSNWEKEYERKQEEKLLGLVLSKLKDKFLKAEEKFDEAVAISLFKERKIIKVSIDDFACACVDCINRADKADIFLKYLKYLAAEDQEKVLSGIFEHPDWFTDTNCPNTLGIAAIFCVSRDNVSIDDILSNNKVKISKEILTLSIETAIYKRNQILLEKLLKYSLDKEVFIDSILLERALLMLISDTIENGMVEYKNRYILKSFNNSRDLIKLLLNYDKVVISPDKLNEAIEMAAKAGCTGILDVLFEYNKVEINPDVKINAIKTVFLKGYVGYTQSTILNPKNFEIFSDFLVKEFEALPCNGHLNIVKELTALGSDLSEYKGILDFIDTPQKKLIIAKEFAAFKIEHMKKCKSIQIYLSYPNRYKYSIKISDLDKMYKDMEDIIKNIEKLQDIKNTLKVFTEINNYLYEMDFYYKEYGDNCSIIDLMGNVNCPLKVQEFEELFNCLNESKETLLIQIKEKEAMQRRVGMGANGDGIASSPAAIEFGNANAYSREI